MRNIPWPALVAVACCALVARADDEPQAGSLHSSQPQSSRLDVGEGAELNRALRRAREPGVEPDSVVAAIAALGTAVLDEALLLLDQRSLPPLDGGKPQVLSAPQQVLLLRGLEQLDDSSVFDAALAHLAPLPGLPAERQPEPTTSARAAAILAAGCGARATELGRMFALAGPCGQAALDPQLERALQTAGTAAFRRDPQGFAAWASNWRTLPVAMLPALVRGAGASGDAHALPLLESVLLQGRDLERLALASLARQQAPREVSEGLLQTLRDMLRTDDSTTQQAACTALAALGDFEGAAHLVELLDQAPPPVRASAYRALCSLSGLALPDQVSSWNTWIVLESQWYESRVETLAKTIAEGEELRALEALRELRLYHWRRHELSDIAARGLQRNEESVVLLACEVLASLRSPWARSLLESAALEPGTPAAAPAAEALARMISG